MSGNSSDEISGVYAPSDPSQLNNCSYNISLEVRKNLTETFEQQIDPPRDTAKAKIPLFESKKSSRVENTTSAPPSKPPRQPKVNSGESQKSSNISSQRENVAVFLRVRPPIVPSTSKDPKENVNTIEILPAPVNGGGENVPTTIRTYPPKESNARKTLRESTSSTVSTNSDGSAVVREFQFQEIFGPEKSQEELYSTIVSPLVDGMFPPKPTKDSSAAVGKSALLFTYGITNAGKTYTILGDMKSKDKRHWGIVPRAFESIFERAKQFKDQLYDLHISYFEIYNEQIYDLLGKTTRNSFRSRSLKLRESHGQILVRGLAKHKVRDVQHGLKLANQARSKRHTSSNNLNKDSSRSHCICQLQLVAKTGGEEQPVIDEDSVASDPSSGYTTDEEVSRMCKLKSSTLWIVDLAGSERSKRTGVSSQRQKEASIINKSLMNLMRCFSVMRANQSSANSNVIVPFRDSKLTHLFMNHLSGSFASRTCMIVNVNPAAIDFDETHRVLSYASQAKAVRVDPKEYQIKQRSLYGDEEYGFDGRKKSHKPGSRLVNIVKKMSPKKAGNKNRTAEERKRRVTAQTTRGDSLLSSFSEVSSLGGEDEPIAKRMRLPRQQQKLSGKSANRGKQDDQTLKSLKMSLSLTQAERDALKSENIALMEEASQIESNVRMEVVEEMEEQIAAIKERYQGVIDSLKAQIESKQKHSPMRITAIEKAKLDNAEEKIDVLLFKVEECEEEMIRMREDHDKEMGEVHADYKEKLHEKEERIEVLVKKAAAQEEYLLQVENKLRDSHAEIETLREYVKKNENEGLMASENQEVLQLKADLLASQKELEKLERSKQELINNYEKLLQEDDDTEDESEEDTDPTPIMSRKLENQQSNRTFKDLVNKYEKLSRDDDDPEQMNHNDHGRLTPGKLKISKSEHHETNNKIIREDSSRIASENDDNPNIENFGSRPLGEIDPTRTAFDKNENSNRGSHTMISTAEKPSHEGKNIEDQEKENVDLPNTRSAMALNQQTELI